MAGAVIVVVVATTVPVPVSAMLCGLLTALSVIVSVAFRLPVVVGLKVTWVVVVLPGASEIGSEPDVKPKSPGLAPVVAMLLIVRVADPELVMASACAELVVPMV